jgi:hypothetical protein
LPPEFDISRQSNGIDQLPVHCRLHWSEWCVVLAVCGWLIQGGSGPGNLYFMWGWQVFYSCCCFEQFSVSCLSDRLYNFEQCQRLMLL